MFIHLKTFKIVNLLQNYLLLSTQKISEVNINVILLMQKEIRIDKSSDLLKAMQESSGRDRNNCSFSSVFQTFRISMVVMSPMGKKKYI